MCCENRIKINSTLVLLIDLYNEQFISLTQSHSLSPWSFLAQTSQYCFHNIDQWNLILITTRHAYTGMCMVTISTGNHWLICSVLLCGHIVVRSHNYVTARGEAPSQHLLQPFTDLHAKNRKRLSRACSLQTWHNVGSITTFVALTNMYSKLHEMDVTQTKFWL